MASRLSAVTILGGTGQQGRGLAQRFATAGLAVTVGSRDPDRARQAVAGWRPAAGGRGSVAVADNAGAVTGAELLVLAVPFASAAALLQEMRSNFREGTVLVDVTVPVTFAGGKISMMQVAEGSAAEHVRAHLPAHVMVAAAFKTLPAHLLSAGDAPLDCDEFVCGDSDQARARAMALVELLPGLRGVDVGPLSRARSIEHLTALAIAVNRRHHIHDARFRVVGLT